jgi:hypothetical protein
VTTGTGKHGPDKDVKLEPGMALDILESRLVQRYTLEP